MNGAVSNSARRVEVDPSGLRIVLFGMPDAGKTSLLGALAEAAVSQHRTLGLHLQDLSGGLSILRDRVYEKGTRETLEEIIPYPVTIRPLSATTAIPATPATIYDCDGRVALEILTHRQLLISGNRDGMLARSVLEAEALLLVIDAALPAEQIQQDFTNFVHFIRFIEARRTRDHAVGGLPVYLVLSKCDLLAEGLQTWPQWEDRVHQRQKEVADRFRDFLSEDSTDGVLPFGSIDLGVYATSVKMPLLRDTPAGATEPLGVAELFRDCFRSAITYRDRVRNASRRLAYTLAGAGGFLFTLVSAGLLFFFSQGQTQQRELSLRIEQYKGQEGATAALRLRGDLPKKTEELLKIETDAEYPLISDGERNYVRLRREELESYRKYRDAVLKLGEPANMRSLADVQKAEEELQKGLAPPQAYATEWNQTEASVLRTRLLKELPVLRDAGRELRDYYLKLGQDGNVLLFTKEVNNDWENSVGQLTQSEKPPIPEADPQRGLAWQFTEVVNARQDWQDKRDRLKILRDVSTALGLIGDPSSPRAVLALTPATPKTDHLKEAAEHWHLLKQNYPEYRSWSLKALPDAVRPQIVSRLQRSVDQEVKESQEMIRGRLGSDTFAEWHKVAEWVTSPLLAEWHDWITFLVRFSDPDAEDPVLALAAFLKRDAHEIQLNAIRLKIPLYLHDRKVKPTGKLKVTFGNDPQKPTTIVFDSDGDGYSDKENFRNYPFRRDPLSPGKLTFKPGDLFSAELDVTEDGTAKKLSWTRFRSGSYQLESLVQEPRLLKPEQELAVAETATGVSVVIEGTFPSIPLLLKLPKSLR